MKFELTDTYDMRRKYIAHKEYCFGNNSVGLIPLSLFETFERHWDAIMVAAKLLGYDYIAFQDFPKNNVGRVRFIHWQKGVIIEFYIRTKETWTKFLDGIWIEYQVSREPWQKFEYDNDIMKCIRHLQRLL
ncbi:hypothetical protein D3C71_1234580 [compost metagenome]